MASTCGAGILATTPFQRADTPVPRFPIASMAITEMRLASRAY